MVVLLSNFCDEEGDIDVRLLILLQLVEVNVAVLVKGNFD